MDSVQFYFPKIKILIIFTNYIFINTLIKNIKFDSWIKFTLDSFSVIFIIPDFLFATFLSLVNFPFDELLTTIEFTIIFGVSFILRLIFFLSISFDIFFKLDIWATLSSLSEGGVPPVILNVQIYSLLCSFHLYQHQDFQQLL